MKNIEDFCEGGNEGCVGSGRHWADNDGVEVIDVHNKLHIFEGPDRESTSEVCVHGTGHGIGKSGKAKHILDCTGFVGGKHMIYLGMGQEHVDAVLDHWRRIWPLSVAVDLGRWEQINDNMRPGMVFSLVLLSRASSSVAAGGKQRS